MATSNVDNNILECPICLGNFETPRTLPCQHSFCERCLQEFIDSNITGGEPSAFLCPVCRQNVEQQHQNGDAKVAASFPVNPVIVSLLDKQKKRPCDCCLRVDENEDGEFWCVICEDILCRKCKGVHRKTRCTFTHEIETPEERRIRNRRQHIGGDLLRASAVLVISVKKPEQSNRKFVLTGGAFLNDHRLIFANNAFSKNKNGCLELFDEKYQFVKSLSIQGRPSDLSVHPADGTIFVVVNMNTILVCEITDDVLSVLKTLETEYDTWGIAISPKGLAVTSTPDEVLYRTYDVRVNTTIEKESNFNEAYVDLCKDGQTMYYVDNDKHVRGVKLDGTSVLNYASDDLRCPSSICVDSRQNVYVCGRKSHNIHQIPSKGKSSRVLCNFSKSEKPNALFFHPTKNMFVVTIDSGDKLFCVYKLE